MTVRGTTGPVFKFHLHLFRVADDIYIDVGLKLNAVCKVPQINAEQYAVGSQVLLRYAADFS